MLSIVFNFSYFNFVLKLIKKIFIMKKTVFTMVLGLGLLTANAQVEKLEGPRIGMTMVTQGSAADFIHKGFNFIDDERNKLGETGSAFTTQYGWQWESRFADGGADITGIVEWVALVGGMEQGLFLPSLSSVIGIRNSNGFEFGVGPNLSLSGVGMVFAVGHNFKSGSLNMPVNLVFMPGKDITANHIKGDGSFEEYTHNTGARISIMVGFNLAK